MKPKRIMTNADFDALVLNYRPSGRIPEPPAIQWLPTPITPGSLAEGLAKLADPEPLVYLMGSAAFEAYERFLSRPQTPLVMVNTSTPEVKLDATKTVEELFADLERMEDLLGPTKKKDPYEGVPQIRVPKRYSTQWAKKTKF